MRDELPLIRLFQFVSVLENRKTGYWAVSLTDVR
jgi:hypothetical protein